MPAGYVVGRLAICLGLVERGRLEPPAVDVGCMFNIVPCQAPPGLTR